MIEREFADGGAHDLGKMSAVCELLAHVAQRYCHTKAGIDANEIQATLFLHRGQVFSAALGFEKLVRMNPDRTKLSAGSSYGIFSPLTSAATKSSYCGRSRGQLI